MTNMSTILSPTSTKNDVCCRRFPSMSLKSNPSVQLYLNHTSTWVFFRTPFYKNTSGGLLLYTITFNLRTSNLELFTKIQLKPGNIQCSSYSLLKNGNILDIFVFFKSKIYKRWTLTCHILIFVFEIRTNKLVQGSFVASKSGGVENHQILSVALDYRLMHY